MGTKWFLIQLKKLSLRKQTINQLANYIIWVEVGFLIGIDGIFSCQFEFERYINVSISNRRIEKYLVIMFGHLLWLTELL